MPSWQEDRLLTLRNGWVPVPGVYQSYMGLGLGFRGTPALEIPTWEFCRIHGPFTGFSLLQSKVWTCWAYYFMWGRRFWHHPKPDFPRMRYTSDSFSPERHTSGTKTLSPASELLKMVPGLPWELRYHSKVRSKVSLMLVPGAHLEMMLIEVYSHP